ncbi:MAG: HemK2/MTQ2 family protein methyltransferase [archaeon]
MIYSPDDDSYLLETQVKLYSKDKTVLDMGTGSGIQALSALNSGAKSVLAVDINKEAITLLKNKYKQKNIKFLHSNLFSKVKSKFDLIIFNPPYLPEDEREDSESALVTTGGKNGDEIILKFLQQSKVHLNKNGLILLLVSSLTPLEKIESLLTKQKMKSEFLSSKKIFFETLSVLKIQKNIS